MITDKYNCPNCGFKPPIDKTYIIKNDKVKKIKIEDENSENIEKYLDNEIWPKIIEMKTEIIDGMFDGNAWTEVHYCPNCKKEFSFENANF